MKDNGRKLLVLDLDETLIFASERALRTRCHFVVDRFFVYLRPGVKEFLKFCSQHFEIGIWTTANQAYAHEMVECVLPPGVDLAFLWSEGDCTMVDVDIEHVALVKDLSKLDDLGVPLHHIVVLEDTREKIAFHLDNVMLISSFNGDPGDRELAKARRYLTHILNEPDVYQAGLGTWLEHPAVTT